MTLYSLKTDRQNSYVKVRLYHWAHYGSLSICAKPCSKKQRCLASSLSSIVIFKQSLAVRCTHCAKKGIDFCRGFKFLRLQTVNNFVKSIWRPKEALTILGTSLVQGWFCKLLTLWWVVNVSSLQITRSDILYLELSFLYNRPQAEN